MSKKFLPSKQNHPAEWYTAVIQHADLADYGPSKGSIIIKPYGYAIWERIQQELDTKIKQGGVDNAYFPLLIPLSLLDKEKGHIEGFSPELAIVTHAGGEKLEEELVIRPTSETIMYSSFAKWIQSWRDLPLMMNQWNNVVRWEKRTLPFLRTSEFLWQEGHTAHATHQEAIDRQQWAIDIYASTYRDLFAIDGYVGAKSSAERFAGAIDTLTFESLMPSGKALQACTSHDLGQNFSKAFGITFQNKEGAMEEVWQTSWGFSTRSMGALIMAHGDDNGLRLPPRIAPIQTVVVPTKATDELLAYCREIMSQLETVAVRTKLDDSDAESFGFKLNKWEVKGVPTIIKVGPKELADSTLTIQRRDELSEAGIAVNDVSQYIPSLLSDMQTAMLASSTTYLQEQTREAHSFDEFKTLLKEHKGFVKVFWNDDSATEQIIKESTKASSRCLIDTKTPGIDFYTNAPTTSTWLFAQSY